MKIEQKLISELIPYANNARTHNPEQITQIASSIKEFGFNNPILIDKDNGKKAIINDIEKMEVKDIKNVFNKFWFSINRKIAINKNNIIEKYNDV